MSTMNTQVTRTHMVLIADVVSMTNPPLLCVNT
jgi:hypothetical protein